MGSENDEIVTASGISPRNIDHGNLRDWMSVGWLIAHDAKVTRLSTPLQVLYDITQMLQGDLDTSAAEPPAASRFRGFFQLMGRAIMDDPDRLTQDALAGTILTIIWKQIAHLAHHIGLSPKKLEYGEPINGQSLTQVLWAIRGAEMHASSWMYRDFKVDNDGREQIEILKAAGINPIPFRAYEALQVVAPKGVSSLLLALIPLMHEMVADAMSVAQAKDAASQRKPSRQPEKKKAAKKSPRRKAASPQALKTRPKSQTA